MSRRPALRVLSVLGLVAAGCLVGSAVTWTAVARDRGTSRYRLTWHPSGALGRHTLTAVAVDRAGNKQQSAVVRVRVRR